MHRVILALLLFLLPTQAYSYDLAASASHTEGIAPLAVNFNADIDDSTPEAETFHSYRYVWDFKDTTAGTWPDGDSKNVAYGPVTAHVFESAGTYAVTLTVYDPSDGSVVTALGETFPTITVTSQDDGFPTTATTCISNDTDFTDCPSGAVEVTKTSAQLESVLGGYLTAGRRVLLKRGDSWSMAAQPTWLNGSGPTVLGAFGTCTSPDTRGICTNAPEITFEDTGERKFFDTTYKTDWTIQDITFINTSDDGHLFAGDGGSHHMLFSRIKSTGFNTPVQMGVYRANETDYIEKIHVYSCDFYDFEAYGIFISGEKTAITGTRQYATYRDHGIRNQQNYLATISHNDLSGAVGWYQIVKLYGPWEETIGDYADVLAKDLHLLTDSTKDTARTWAAKAFRFGSKYIVFSYNLIGGGGGGYSVAVKSNCSADYPEACDQRISDVIMEGNTWLSGYGPSGRTGTADQAFHVVASYATVRNNVFDATEADGSFRAIGWSRDAKEPAHYGFRVYNNTFYSKDAGALKRYAITINSGSDSTARNNLVSFPGSTGVHAIFETATTVQSNNVLTDSPAFEDPDNATVTDRDFHLTAASDDAALLATGYDTPLMDDLENTARTLTEYDIGAYEYDDGVDTAPPTYNTKRPEGILVAGTTSTTVSFNTSEEANCRWDTTAAAGATDALKYADLGNAFAQNPGESFSLTASSLTDGMATRTYYIRCVDTAASPNYTTSDETITVDVDDPAASTPLEPWDSFPEDYEFEFPAGTGDTATLSFLLDSDEDRVGSCRYQDTATPTSDDQTEAATDYAAMEYAFPQVDQHNAQTEITVVDGETKTWYARCKDNSVTPIYMLVDYSIETITQSPTACYLDSDDCTSADDCYGDWPAYSWCADLTPSCRHAPCVSISSGNFVSGTGTVGSGTGTWVMED